MGGVCLLLMAGVCARAATNAHASAVNVALEDLAPTATEWGTEPWLEGLQYGVRVADFGGGFPRVPPVWEGETKIIKSYPADFLPPEGEYRSLNTNLFAVGGELMTGVGLFSRRTGFYHWVEYTVPAGATMFQGELYVADDVNGGWNNGNDQAFVFRVQINGQTVAQAERNRGAPDAGSGMKICDLNARLPPGSKTIRFFLMNNQVGNGNANTELIIHGGRFLGNR